MPSIYHFRILHVSTRRYFHFLCVCPLFQSLFFFLEGSIGND